MKPYQDLETGLWNGLPEVKTVREVIACKLSDDDDNRYHAIIEVDVNDYEVTVISINCTTDKELPNANDDIRDAIREAGHRRQEINFLK